MRRDSSRHVDGVSRPAFVAICAVTLVTAAGGSTPLIDAVKAGDRDAIRALLKNGDRRERPRGRRHHGTPLGRAGGRCRDASQALLRAGAKANVANRNGITPLSLAALNGTRSSSKR